MKMATTAPDPNMSDRMKKRITAVLLVFFVVLPLWSGVVLSINPTFGLGGYKELGNTKSGGMTGNLSLSGGVGYISGSSYYGIASGYRLEGEKKEDLNSFFVLLEAGPYDEEATISCNLLLGYNISLKEIDVGFAFKSIDPPLATDVAGVLLSYSPLTRKIRFRVNVNMVVLLVFL